MGVGDIRPRFYTLPIFQILLGRDQVTARSRLPSFPGKTALQFLARQQRVERSRVVRGWTDRGSREINEVLRVRVFQFVGNPCSLRSLREFLGAAIRHRHGSRVVKLTVVDFVSPVLELECQQRHQPFSPHYLHRDVRCPNLGQHSGRFDGPL